MTRSARASSSSRRPGSRLAAAAAGLLLGLALCLVPASSAIAGKPKHHPRHRNPPPSYWGAWVGDQFTGTAAPYDMNAVSAFQGLVGKPLSMIEFSVPFANCEHSCYFYGFPTTEMEKIRQYGAIPFLSWGSSSIPIDVNEPDFQLADIANGNYDSYIRAFAQSAAAWGHPFFLRYDWEMTGNWFPWDEGVNGNGPFGSGEYIAAWRHVHDIFASVGATNATWVWCPLVSPQNTLAKLKSVYPGSAYVNWTCLDGYNWGPTPVNPHPWRTFDQIFKTDYTRVVKKIAPKKPMVLAELGSNSAGGNKGAWISNMFKQLRSNYRKVRGIIWFDVVDRAIDWPLETNGAAASAFARGIAKAAYKPNQYGGLGGGAVGLPH